jgi:ribonucleotide monophosphatase NagD (HAD superfamily)
VAALEYATGATALLAGKPSPAMYDARVAGLAAAGPADARAC